MSPPPENGTCFKKGDKLSSLALALELCYLELNHAEKDHSTTMIIGYQTN